MFLSTCHYYYCVETSHCLAKSGGGLQTKPLGGGEGRQKTNGANFLELIIAKKLAKILSIKKITRLLTTFYNWLYNCK